MDIIEFNLNHTDQEFHPEFASDQRNFEICLNQTKLSSVDQKHLLNKTRQWGGELGIDKTLKQYDLDALIVADTLYALVMMASAAGYPLISVPMGYKQLNGQPFGLIIAGTSWSEPMLLRIAHGFEQVSRVRDQRRPPYAAP
ncbi:unnamed protein product [Rotaria sp. Silwood1]|nr:unnamed protein product [Rotaria sp. Silwood1]CAF1558792.1 unnamed protein product [Rotaria sp. Silwood1]CAF1561215.1 unnamed protein product [Rotaria sp. Silwood1]CAF3655287.1 unnamed protein product [Rotaria sp. Silwood1]CAF3662901.1 unnamed protein product [Rotaria sp. Silwood1]